MCERRNPIRGRRAWAVAMLLLPLLFPRRKLMWVLFQENSTKRHSPWTKHSRKPYFSPEMRTTTEKGNRRRPMLSGRTTRMRTQMRSVVFLQFLW